MIVDTELLQDRLADAPESPALSLESCIEGPLREDSQNLLPLLWSQQRGATGRPSAPERTEAPGVWPQRFGPLTDGLGRNAESGRDLSVSQPALTKKATAFETPLFLLARC